MLLREARRLVMMLRLDDTIIGRLSHPDHIQHRLTLPLEQFLVPSSSRPHQREI